VTPVVSARALREEIDTNAKMQLAGKSDTPILSPTATYVSIGNKSKNRRGGSKSRPAPVYVEGIIDPKVVAIQAADLARVEPEAETASSQVLVISVLCKNLST
jgi:hypothetical protein